MFSRLFSDTSLISAPFAGPTAVIIGSFLMTACAANSPIANRIDAMAPPPSQEIPIGYVETFPGQTDGCDASQMNTRAWNTHPVRAIQANFARPATNGAVDYFSVNIPAGQILTVGTCATNETELLDARFIDRS